MKKLITLILICWVVSTLSNTVHAPLINGANAAEPYLFVSANDWGEGYLATLIDGRYLWVGGGVFEVPSEVSPAEIIKRYAKMYEVDYDRALRIAKCESGLNPLAINKSSGATGIYQFIISWHPEVSRECALNAECNIEKAMQHMALGAWGLWECK